MKKVLFLLFIILINACTIQGQMKSISFLTDDQVNIVGNYWQGGKNAVLLLHMMPATKESWEYFAEDLHKENFTVLAIDLRGHGESMEQEGGILNYKTFTDEEHQDSIKDVEAAVDYLKEQGAENIAIIGASIGANLALEYQSEHPEIKKAVLLSAGTNYRGIEILPYAAKLREDQQVYFVAGSLDGRSAGSADAMAKEIAQKIKKKEIKIYNSTAHGTDLFAEDDTLSKILIDWLKN
ncbi:alpha/beta fold hydrolase [Candidatus Woesearchaeota archaeon]|nr:alpha/beta fold hydrolase [Candidatus Woesearchaeota archaeon]